VIDVIQTVTCPNRVYTYSLAAMPSNATSILWTVPAAGTLVSGQGTTSITVSYPATEVSGVVTAQAINNCGNSATRSSNVKLGVCAPEERTFSKGGSVGIPTASEKFTVNVAPNPTVADFKVQVLTSGKEKITVRILDMQGRMYKTLTVTASSLISIGNDLKAGSYLMEVRQGNNVKTTKLLKF